MRSSAVSCWSRSRGSSHLKLVMVVSSGGCPWSGDWCGGSAVVGTDHVAGDHQLLDLGGAFKEAEQAHVAVEALDAVFGQVAGAAEDLHGPVGHATAHLRGEHLGTGCLGAH